AMVTGRCCAAMRATGVGLALVLVVSVAVASAAGGSAPTHPIWGTPVRAGSLPAEASEVTEVLSVDLDGDGRQDVVVQPTNGSLPAEVGAAAPVFLLTRGNGRFVDETQQLFGGPAPLIVWGRELMTADFNGDNRADIFIADHGHANDYDHSSPLNF